MKTVRLILFCLATPAFSAQAQTPCDSTGILYRMAIHSDPVRETGASVFDHAPAAQLYRYEASLSTVGVQGELRSENRAILPAEGDGSLAGAFSARSYLRIDDRSAASAGASYERGRTDGVRWNSTADYRLLRPYVLADSVGGDLSTEEYAFNGQYMRRDGRISYGLGIDYRARHEYRQSDPRPHNIVDDIQGILGAGWNADGYLFAASARGRIYKQTQALKFFDTKGANAVEYLMTGLGSYIDRYYGGEEMSILYKGRSYGARLTVVPTGATGWSAAVDYERFRMEPLFSKLNYVAAGRLVRQTLSAAVRHCGSRATAAIEAEYELRQGFENVIENASTADYRILGDFAMYRSRTLRTRAHGAVAWRRAHSSFVLLPQAEWLGTSTDYRYPYRSVAFSTLDGGCDLSFALERSRSRLRVTAGGRYLHCLGQRIELDDPTLPPAQRSLLATTVGRVSDSRFALRGEFRWERMLSHSSALLLAVRYRPAFYDGGVRVHHALLQAAVCF